MKVKVISLPYIFQVLFVLCFTRPRYQVSVYRTIGPLVACGCALSVECRAKYRVGTKKQEFVKAHTVFIDLTDSYEFQVWGSAY